MTRCIVYSNENGSKEGVYFTEDLTTDALDFIPYDCTLDDDFTITCKLPIAFPFDYNLERN